MLLIACDFHNHSATENFEGHSFAGRLSEEEEKLVVDMSKTLIQPRDILHTLKQRNNLNVSTLRTVHNVRKKHRIAEYARKSQMQQLLKNLSEQEYIEFHRSCLNTDTIKDILWAHPASIELLHVFRHILIMNCTYKTNRYQLPLMEIVGVTSTEMTFSVVFAYLETEREDDFSWCLDSLRLLMHRWHMPLCSAVSNRTYALCSSV